MKNISIEKLVYLIENQNCKGIACQESGKHKCPLFDIGCSKFTDDPERFKKDIEKAMEHHKITKANIVEHLIGKKN